MTERKEKYDLVGAIMEFEDGTLELDGILRLFSYLMKSGQLMGMQGAYQRMASELVRREYLSPKGDILFN